MKWEAVIVALLVLVGLSLGMYKWGHQAANSMWERHVAGLKPVIVTKTDTLWLTNVQTKYINLTAEDSVRIAARVANFISNKENLFRMFQPKSAYTPFSEAYGGVKVRGWVLSEYHPLPDSFAAGLWFESIECPPSEPTNTSIISESGSVGEGFWRGAFVSLGADTRLREFKPQVDLSAEFRVGFGSWEFKPQIGFHTLRKEYVGFDISKRLF